MWWFIATFAISLLAASKLIPKPQSTPPPAFTDLQVPTAEEGAEIPVVFGTCLVSPNVVWWGDLRTTAIKKKGGKK